MMPTDVWFSLLMICEEEWSSCLYVPCCFYWWYVLHSFSCILFLILFSVSGPTVQRTRASPLISVSRTHFKVYDWVRLNCSSPDRTEEKARLRWYINDIEAAPENVKYLKSGRSVGLHLQLKPIHHQLNLRCRSVSSEILTESATTLLLESRDRDIEGREAQSVSSATHSLTTALCLKLYPVSFLLLLMSFFKLHSFSPLRIFSSI